METEKVDKTEKNDKVLAMYHAVWKLIDEGNDIHKIKVSDITECAGIGKGTAYEYFRSKEELVTKAMQYNISMQFQMLYKRIHEQNSYRKGLEVCFDWMAETRDRRHLFMEFMRRSEEGQKIADSFCSKSEKEIKAPLLSLIEEILKDVVQLGRKEGLVPETLPDHLVTLQIISQLLGFFVYQEFADFTDETDRIKTKDFLCDNIIKSLSDR